MLHHVHFCVFSCLWGSTASLSPTVISQVLLYREAGVGPFREKDLLSRSTHCNTGAAVDRDAVLALKMGP